MPEFPQAYHIVRKAALRLALTRALVKAAQIIKRLNTCKGVGSGGASVAGASITAIFDMALEQAAEARQMEAAEEEGKKEPIPLSLKSLTGVARSVAKLGVKSPQATAHATRPGRWGKLQRSVAGAGCHGSPPRTFRADAPGPRRSLSGGGNTRAAPMEPAGDAIDQVNDRLGRLEASVAACLQELTSLRCQTRSDGPPGGARGPHADCEGNAPPLNHSYEPADPTSPDPLRVQRRRRPRRNKLAGAKSLRDQSQSSERQELREENAREYSRSQMSPFISAEALEA